MSERLFPMNTALGTIEYMRPVIPRLPEIVDLWSDYLEYWAQTGGMDEAGDDELEQAHQAVQSRTREILLESTPNALSFTPAYSNMALAAAQDLRQRSFSADPGEVNV